ncbi:MAG: hypothetical protein JWR03_847 [Cohnella sp.]|jgi:hypothetical protein|nr:hypothetical protein [Cohnella sp.]
MGDSGSREGQPNRPTAAAADRSLADTTEGTVEQASSTARSLGILSERIERISVEMEKAHLQEYVQLALHPWQLIWRNLIYGLFRGIGIALGFTFFAATIVWLLQILGKLNLPIVGDFIADIVRIVQRQLQIRPF